MTLLILTIFLYLAPPMLTELQKVNVIEDKTIMREMKLVTERIGERIDNDLDRCIVGRIVLDRRFGDRMKIDLVMPFDDGDIPYLKIRVNDGRRYNLKFIEGEPQFRRSTDNEVIVSLGYLTSYHYPSVISARLVRFLITAN